MPTNSAPETDGTAMLSRGPATVIPIFVGPRRVTIVVAVHAAGPRVPASPFVTGAFLCKGVHGPKKEGRCGAGGRVVAAKGGGI